ncbi:MAG: serine hydrolase domain-containing protein [Gemmatimonadota bacterium]
MPERNPTSPCHPSPKHGFLRRPALVGLVLTALAWGAPAPAQETDGTPDPSDEGLRAIHLVGESLRETSSLPGLAIAVGDGGGVVFSEAFGVADLETRSPATPLTRWRIGSISKSLTAAGAALLAQRGRLDLDASVATLLPSLAERPVATATPRQLAGHLGGVRHYRDGEGIRYDHYDDVVASLDLFVDDSLVAPPGREYSYSTYGYVLLSALMQRAAGEPFLTWMEREVFRPAGMTHTGPDVVTRVVPCRASFYEIRDGRLVPAPFTDNSYKWAGGGFLSTPEDLVRFGETLLEEELLDSAGVASLFTSQRDLAGERTGYGMGFRPDEDGAGRRVVHHGGSSEGARAFLLSYPDQGVVVAMAANRATAPLFEEEAEALAHFVLDHGGRSDAYLDAELAGAWTVSGTLGSGDVEGTLRLWDGGGTRGVLEWGDDQTPIRIVLVDRHPGRLLLLGTGPHGVMRMELEPTEDGWTGRWDYLGRDGSISIGPGGAP